ncbi:MAG: hypothetical protein RL434_2448 [Pseudomonadota bacterium]
MDERIFANRRAAGRALAEVMEPWAGAQDTLILALPRGGVPVAHELALALGLPLDVFIVRKLGVPGQPEVAMGAVASGGACLLNRSLINWLDITPEALAEETATEQQELARRERVYRGQRPLADCKGKTVILVDDGVATGASMRVAVSALRRAGAARIVVAIPVAPSDALAQLEEEADEVVCLSVPRIFGAIGQFYEDFTQVTDEEVIADLAAHGAALPGSNVRTGDSG